MCCKVLYFILSEDDFEIKSKIYSLNLRLVLNHTMNSQDALSFRNLFFTLFFKLSPGHGFWSIEFFVLKLFILHVTYANMISYSN
jgi:hypothetical protein